MNTSVPMARGRRCPPRSPKTSAAAMSMALRLRLSRYPDCERMENTSDLTVTGMTSLAPIGLPTST